MWENLFGKEKYVSQFIHYQKLHFSTLDILKGEYSLPYDRTQNYTGDIFWRGGIFLPFTLVI